MPGGYAEAIRVAYPLVISMGSFTLMQFCDRMFLAWYSSSSIQAALPAGILSFTLISGFMALAGYAGTFVAQYYGAGDGAGCSRATVQGCILALLSWPWMLLMMPVGQGLLRISGHAPDVLHQELVYFNILMLGSVLVPLGAALSGFFTGRGDTLTNMLANLAGNLVNIMLDYAMIFGHWGFAERGIAGAAWATVISGLVAPAILAAIYFSGPLHRRYATRRHLRPERALLGRLVRFGLPSAVHMVLDVGAFTLFVLMTGRLNRVAFAASNIAFSINNLAFMPLIGIGIAASTLVGQYQGRRDSVTAEKTAWTSMKVGFFYMVVVALSFLLFPSAYFSLFAGRGHDPLQMNELLPVGRWLLVMMAAWGMLDAVNLILSGALKGAGDTRFVMYYSIAMTWAIWIPGEVVILYVLRLGLLPAWGWMMVFVIATAAGFFLRFRSGRWKAIDLLGREIPIQPNRSGADALVVAE